MIVESYINLFPKDVAEKEKYLDRVYDLYCNAYKDIGIYVPKEELMNDNVFWKMQRKGGVVSAVIFYKIDPLYGRKVFICGHDGSRQGKDEMNAMLYSSLIDRKEQMAWAEASGAVEHMLQKWGAIPIPAEVAKKLLEKSKDREITLQPLEDGFHYKREINDVLHTKIMYGNVPPIIYKQIELGESYKPLLLEDKMVKFGGSVYPKNGWCVIMCGAPGSGKSTVLNNLVPIDAKVYNPDYLKEFTVRHGDISGNVLTIGKNSYPLDGIDPPYTLKNPEYVSFLHKNLKPLNNKLRDSIYNMGINAEEGRLPNVAFDIAGSDIADFENIFFNLAPLGYKFCVVWVFNTLERAIQNNMSRERTGLRELIISKYFDVLSTIPNFMRRVDMMEQVSDFWIVLPVVYDLSTREGKHRYVKEDNVRKLDIDNGVAQLTWELEDMIFTQQAEVLDRYRKELYGNGE